MTVEQLTRLWVAAKHDLDATLMRFEAATMRGADLDADRLRDEAHTHLDSLVDLKARTIKAAIERQAGNDKG
jgi:hypothetical protein